MFAFWLTGRNRFPGWKPRSVAESMDAKDLTQTHQNLKKQFKTRFHQDCLVSSHLGRFPPNCPLWADCQRKVLVGMYIYIYICIYIYIFINIYICTVYIMCIYIYIYMIYNVYIYIACMHNKHRYPRIPKRVLYVLQCRAQRYWYAMAQLRASMA